MHKVGRIRCPKYKLRFLFSVRSGRQKEYTEQKEHSLCNVYVYAETESFLFTSFLRGVRDDRTKWVFRRIFSSFSLTLWIFLDALIIMVADQRTYFQKLINKRYCIWLRLECIDKCTYTVRKAKSQISQFLLQEHLANRVQTDSFRS